MKPELPTIDGWEADYFYARKYHKFNAGIGKYIKRKYAKRLRNSIKRDVSIITRVETEDTQSLDCF